MNLFRLFATLTLSSESYKKGIADAKKENQGFEQSTGKMSKAAVAGWLAVIAVIVKAVKAIGNLIVETASYGSEITKLSQKLGLSKQAVQEWDYVAQQNGTTVESLSTAMKTLSTAAADGNSDLINLIGTVKDGNGQLKSQEQLLRETLAALSAIENPTERNAKANKVLGRSYQELGGIINMTTAEIDAMISKAHELGIVLSDETVAAANKFDTEMSSLKMMRKAAFAELIFGDPAEGERILNEYVIKIQEMMPKFIEAGSKIAGSILKGLLKIFWPGILGAVAGAAAFAAYGLPPQIGAFLGFLLGTGAQQLFGKIFGSGNPGGLSSQYSDNESVSSATSSMASAYTSSTSVTQTMDVRITAEGNTPVSEQTAVDVGKAVLDMLNQVQVTI